MKYKYISLFSGIGGFECAIQNVFPNAECIAYSEIKPAALKVYQHHFPNHQNLGDITKITKAQLDRIVAQKCNLIVGGFPCTNLTSISRLCKYANTDGLAGPQSGLFFNMLYIIDYIQRHTASKCYFIIENNASMSNQNKQMITEYLEKLNDGKNQVFLNMIDAGWFGVQIRRRLFWTNFPLNMNAVPKQPLQKMGDVLDPFSKVQDHIRPDSYVHSCYNKLRKLNNNHSQHILYVNKNSNNTWSFKKTKINGYYNAITRIKVYSDTITNCCVQYTPSIYNYPIGKFKPIVGDHTLIFDRRLSNRHKHNQFVIRRMTIREMERAFFYTDGYVSDIKLPYTVAASLLSNSVVVKCIEFILEHL